MPLMPYATPQDLAAWLDADGEDSVDNAVGLLRAATIVVAKACDRNPYTDTPSGTDVDVLRDATCAQAASWIALGIDPDRAGLTDSGTVKRTELFTGKVEYDTQTDAALLVKAATELCSQASDLLLAAGLLWQALPQGDDMPYLPTWGLVGPRDYIWPALSEGPVWPWYA